MRDILESTSPTVTFLPVILEAFLLLEQLTQVTLEPFVSLNYDMSLLQTDHSRPFCSVVAYTVVRDPIQGYITMLSPDSKVPQRLWEGSNHT